MTEEKKGYQENRSVLWLSVPGLKKKKITKEITKTTLGPLEKKEVILNAILSIYLNITGHTKKNSM